MALKSTTPASCASSQREPQDVRDLRPKDKFQASLGYTVKLKPMGQDSETGGLSKMFPIVLDISALGLSLVALSGQIWEVWPC